MIRTFMGLWLRALEAAVIVRTLRELGGLVRQARENAGLTQAEFAAKLNTRRQQVIYLERGEGQISTAFLLDVLKTLGLGFVITEGGASASMVASKRQGRKAAPYSIDDIADGHMKRTKG
jgi:transcriptional regulator with XRE-family HTH domain